MAKQSKTAQVLHEEFASILSEIETLSDHLDCFDLIQDQRLVDEFFRMNPYFLSHFRYLLESDIIVRFYRIFDEDETSISLYSLTAMIHDASKRDSYVATINEIKSSIQSIHILRNKVVAHADRDFLAGHVEFRKKKLEYKPAEVSTLRQACNDLIGQLTAISIANASALHYLRGSADALTGVMRDISSRLRVARELGAWGGSNSSG